MFCTNPDGAKGERARQWGLVDDIAPPAKFPELIRARTQALVATSTRPADTRGITLTAIDRQIDDKGYHYRHVDVAFDRAARTATITVRAPEDLLPQTIDAIHAEGDQWWPLAMARELDDAILMLRTNELELGLWLLKTSGSVDAVLASDRVMRENCGDWLVRETIGLLRRTFARLDVSSRSMYAIIEPGSCFAGVLFELALAADRSYMLALSDDEGESPKIALDEFNFGLLPAGQRTQPSGDPLHRRNGEKGGVREDVRSTTWLRRSAGSWAW